MEIRKKIIEQARGWLGTEFHHQGRLKKTASSAGGCDCLGLIIGVAKELNLKNSKQNIGMFIHENDKTNYGKLPDGAKFKNKLSEILYEKNISEMQAGDLALIEFDGNPQHIAIISDYPGGGFGLIHCYSEVGMVVEHGLDDLWLKKINSVFSLFKD